MTKKEKLIRALERGPATKWGGAILDNLLQGDVIFAGNDDAAGIARVGDLLRLYRIRYDSLRDRGVNLIGVEELITSLESLDARKILEVQPFNGVRANIVAFWDGVNNLVGCIAIEI